MKTTGESLSDCCEKLPLSVEEEQIYANLGGDILSSIKRLLLNPRKRHFKLMILMFSIAWEDERMQVH